MGRGQSKCHHSSSGDLDKGKKLWAPPQGTIQGLETGQAGAVSEGFPSDGVRHCTQDPRMNTADLIEVGGCED